MALRFRRSQRLLKAGDFASVFDNRLARGNAFFQLYVRPNSLGQARLGLIVAKKVAKRANRRNYIKRTVREWFRLQQHELADVDIVVRARQAYTREDRDEAMRALSALISKLARPPCRACS